MVLQPNEVAQVVKLLQDGTSICEGLLCLPAQSKKHGGDTSKLAVTRGELYKTAEKHQPNRRTNICVFVQGGTGGVLPGMFLTKLSESMRAQYPLVVPVLTAKHHAARLALVREHQKWQVCL